MDIIPAVVCIMPIEKDERAAYVPGVVEGMLCIEMLSLFDVGFDFAKGRLRLWAPGTALKAGLVEIPGAVLNETGLIGIRLTSPGMKQPVLAFIDCGASFWP